MFSFRATGKIYCHQGGYRIIIGLCTNIWIEVSIKYSRDMRIGSVAGVCAAEEQNKSVTLWSWPCKKVSEKQWGNYFSNQSPRWTAFETLDAIFGVGERVWEGEMSRALTWGLERGRGRCRGTGQAYVPGCKACSILLAKRNNWKF